MNKKMKTVFICILITAILTIVILLFKINSRLPENPSDHAGNTAGNLYNRGLFVETEDTIYFANPADSYRLYRMDKSLENIERVTKDSVEYLNRDASSDYLYYARINYRQNTLGTTAFDLLSTGIYRIKLQSSDIFRLYDSSCGAVLLAGNQLLYQAHGEDGSYDLCALPTNEKRPVSTLLTTDPILPVSFFGGLAYYSGVGADHYLYACSPETNTSRTIAEINCYLPIAAAGGVFFLSVPHNYALFFLPDNSDTAILLAENRISSYNLSADQTTLFYQIDNGRNNRLCRYDIASETETILLEGDYKNLNTVSDYLFFTDFSETNCYCYDINADTVFTFMPDAEQ